MLSYDLALQAKWGFMESIGSFVHIKKQDWHFSGCSTCKGDCCNGAKGFVGSPLILEDFAEVYEYFPILFSFKEEKLSAYVLLNDGKSHCPYYVDHRCSIYEHRTPACKLYPVSPYFEHIFVDTQCPAINAHRGGKAVCMNGVLQSDFYTKRLENFVEKLEKTDAFLESINHKEHFEYVGDVSGLPLYIYAKQSDSAYIQMHQSSLKHFWHYFGVKAIELKRAVS